jgi:hypothetical protein
MALTPHLQITEVADGQQTVDVTVNEALRRAEAVIQGNVIDKDLTAPPGGASDGDRYIVGSGATGDWYGQDDDFAYYKSGTWLFLTPEEGWLVYVQDENLFYLYSSGWAALTGAALQSTILQLTDTPSSYSGQGYKGLRVNAGATAVEFTEWPFDVSAFLAGVPGSSAILTRIPVARAVRFPDNFSGSSGSAAVAATASTAFDIQKNGSSIGTMTFAIGATTATFTTAGAGEETFAAGNTISVVAPGTPDATLAGVGFTLKGYVG